jgi:hypothetical protein
MLPSVSRLVGELHDPLTGRDGAGRQRFYARLFGWQTQSTGTPGYGRILAGKNGIPGAIGNSWDGGAAFVADPEGHVVGLAQGLQRGLEQLAARH